jgi:predicted S18 family serine protease
VCNRRLLKEEFEQDKFTLDQILIQTADKEKKLFEEVEKQRQKALFYCEQVSNYRIKHQTQMLQMKDQMKQMLEAIKQEMDIEKNQWKQKYTKAITLLHTAKEDMIHLTKRNQELEEQLLQVLVWEKPL